jgi:hypothetical protein
MANVRHENRVIRSSQEQPAPVAARPPRKRERTSVSNRVKWALAGMMLGAAAGWTIFQAFLTLVTLD